MAAANVTFTIIPPGVSAVIREAGIKALTLMGESVKNEAILNTPGQGRTPYEPTSLQTGKLRESINLVVRRDGRSARISATTPYALRQEYRIVKSGRRKAYLRPALKSAVMPTI